MPKKPTISGTLPDTDDTRFTRAELVHKAKQIINDDLSEFYLKNTSRNSLVILKKLVIKIRVFADLDILTEKDYKEYLEMLTEIHEYWRNEFK